MPKDIQTAIANFLRASEANPQNGQEVLFALVCDRVKHEKLSPATAFQAAVADIRKISFPLSPNAETAIRRTEMSL